jgi:hypothetical protein
MSIQLKTELRPLFERVSPTIRAPMQNPIRVLVLAADQCERQRRLRLDREVKAIADAIRGSSHRDMLDLRMALAVRTDDVLAELRHHRPHVLHLAGHATETAGFVLCTPSGRVAGVDGEDLAAVLKATEPRPRMLVLNACGTLGVAERLRNEVDFIIAMERPINDRTAILFSSEFYGALASGDSVEHAHLAGIARLALEKTGEQMTPKLLMRDGIMGAEVLVAEPEPDAREPQPPRPESPSQSGRNHGTINVSAEGHVEKAMNVVGDYATGNMQ